MNFVKMLKIFVKLYLLTNKEREVIEMSKPKLIIHETDCHGSGKFYYNGKWDYYSYDDEYGDIRAAVQGLIDIGFINVEDVAIFTDEDELYKMVEKGLNV